MVLFTILETTFVFIIPVKEDKLYIFLGIKI